MSGFWTLALVIFIIAVIAALLFVLGVGGNFFSASKKIKVTVGGAEFVASVADNVMSRTQGLSGRERLGADEALLFIFGSPSILEFWMKDMNFPIDIIWINEGRVVGFAENAQPEPGVALWNLKRYSSFEPADVVLEVNAGVVGEKGIKVGDEVFYDRK